MPSSFSRVVSSTSGFSPSPPVSVWGTVGTKAPLAGFPGAGTGNSGSGRSPPPVSSLRLMPGGFAALTPCSTSAAYPSAAMPRPARRRIGRTLPCRRGNICPLPIGRASRLRLRDRLTPGGLTFPGNPRAIGARAFHPRFRILMPAFSFPMSPAAIACRLPRHTGRSPTTPYRYGIHGFGGALSPDNFGRGRASTSELLRFL